MSRDIMLRDEFAMRALQGLLAGGHWYFADAEENSLYVDKAYELADAMIARRNGGPQHPLAVAAQNATEEMRRMQAEIQSNEEAG